MIRIFNVGHGEAIELYLSPHRILRDFGRSIYSIPTNTSVTCERIDDCCKGMFWPFKNDEIVLSHAHEDHFSGFKYLYDSGASKVFDRAYIPWLKFTELESLGGCLVVLSTYLCIYYGINTAIGNNAKHWLIAAPILSKLARSLFGVAQGHQIQNWNPSGTVLWPPIEVSSTENKLNAKIHAIEEDIRNKDLIAEIRKNVIKPIYNIHREIYNAEPNVGSYSEANYPAEIEGFFETMEGYTEQLREFPMDRGAIAVHNRTIDDHSIVLEIGSKYLILSDLNPPSIARMIEVNNLRNKDYELIKSAHHGTRYSTAFERSNITANTVVHCCGPAHPNWKGPCTDYDKLSESVICTDWKNNSSKWTNKESFNFYERCCSAF